MSEQVIRADLDAERAVLSAMLLSEDAALEAVDIIAAEHFYADANKRVFEAARSILAEGGHVDVVAVASRLREIGRLQEIGGATYLASLADATPAVAHVAEHAKIVKNQSRIRRALAVFTTLAAEARSNPIEDVDAWLEECEARAYGATCERGDGKPTASGYVELTRDAYQEIAQASRQGRQMLGRSTGFASLDEHLGGIETGDLICLAARPGHGKTALALQVLENVATDRGRPGAGIFFSQEMQRTRLMLRSFARKSGESLRALRTGQPSNWKSVSNAAQALAMLPVVIDDEKRLTPLKVRSKVRRHYNTIRARNPGIDLGIVVIDYVQLMAADSHIKGETRAGEIGRITRELKILAGEMGCAVLMLSQLRRADKARGKAGHIPEPTLEDLRDSGAIEADSDVVLAIHREDEHREAGQEPDGIAKIITLKGRNSGRALHELHFDGPTTSFSEPHAGAQQDMSYGAPEPDIDRYDSFAG